jgi:endoglucanase
MTISDPTRYRPDNDETLVEPHGDGKVAAISFWRHRRLTALVMVWVVAVVSAAAFVLLRSSSDAQLAPTAASTLTERLYVDPNSQAAAWVQANAGSPGAQTIKERIAEQPTAKWFGAWSGDITSAVSQYTTAAAEANQVPVLVAYNLPGRDCGGQSAGGAASAQEYNTWIDGFAAGLDGRQAAVILEPDALPQLDSCLDAAGQQERLRMLSRAVDRLQSRNVWVYLDAGHSNWVPAEQMADRLESANIDKAHGFSLNVSNYNPTDGEAAYGREIDSALGESKPFVIDTSRNGNGSPDGEWCNPAGRKLGQAPQAGGGAEMLLWVKAPGESDGDCGVATGTQAGQFSPQLATKLINGK